MKKLFFVPITLIVVLLTMSSSLPTKKIERIQYDFSDITVVRAYINQNIKETDYDQMSKYAGLIIKQSQSLGLPVNLVIALVITESEFNENARNRNKNGTSDHGLFQLNSSTFYWLSSSMLMNPKKNIELGTVFLRDLYDEMGTYEKAIASYNCGPSRVRHDQIPRATREYVKKVFEWEQQLNVLYLNERGLLQP